MNKYLPTSAFPIGAHRASEYLHYTRGQQYWQYPTSNTDPRVRTASATTVAKALQQRSQPWSTKISYAIFTINDGFFRKPRRDIKCAQVN